MKTNTSRTKSLTFLFLLLPFFLLSQPSGVGGEEPCNPFGGAFVIEVEYEEGSCSENPNKLTLIYPDNSCEKDKISEVLWTQPDGSEVITTDPFLNISEIGDYYVIVTYNDGGSGDSSIRIQREPLYIKSSWDYGCNGDVELTAVLTNNKSNENVQYSWVDSNGNDVGDTEIIYVFEPGNYTLEVHDINGCVYIAELYVLIHEVISISASTSYGVMCGEQATIPVVINNPDPSWYYDCSIFRDGNWIEFQSFSSSTFEIIVNDPGKYKVEIHSVMACPTTINFEVEDGISVPLEDAEICEGDTFAFDATPQNSDITVLSYSWLNSNLEVVGTESVFETSVAGEYSVSVTTNTSCVYEENVSLTVNSIPNIELFESLPLCDDPCAKPIIGIKFDENENIIFSEYVWTLPDASVVKTVEPELYAVIEGKYSLSVVSEYGCVGGADISILFMNTPVSDIGSCDILDLPSNSNVILSNVVQDGNGGSFFYSWSKDGVAVPLENESKLIVDVDGAYQIHVDWMYMDGSNMCGYYSTSDVVNVSFSSEEESLIDDVEVSIRENETQSLRVNSTYNSYLWSTGETTQQIEIKADDYGIGEHEIWVEVGDYSSSYGKRAEDNGSSKVVIRDEVKLVVSVALGLEYSLSSKEIKLSPIPTKDILNIELPSGAYESIAVELVSSLGIIVLKQNFKNQNRIKLDLSTISSGVYIVIINYDDKTFRERIVKE